VMVLGGISRACMGMWVEDDSRAIVGGLDSSKGRGIERQSQ